MKTVYNMLKELIFQAEDKEQRISSVTMSSGTLDAYSLITILKKKA